MVFGTALVIIIENVLEYVDNFSYKRHPRFQFLFPIITNHHKVSLC